MTPSDRWYWDIDPTKTQGLIVDSEGFTVMEIRSYWADLESVMKHICVEHNQRVDS